MSLRHVFKPLKIGSIEVENRIVRTAHDTGMAFPDITDDFVSYHAARAKGGCGLTILEAARVHPSTGLHVRLYGDAIVPGFRRLMAAVQPYGMKIFQQLWHGGNLYPAEDGSPPWAVSDLPGYWGIVGQTMALANIAELKAAFVKAALNCQEGGLHGVEIHACHGYIFHQFIAPFYNNRDDLYGGSWENRTRFLFEVMREIRAGVDRGFVVGVRLAASELPGGISAEDNRRLLRQMQDEKLIDFVDFSKGDYYRFDTMVGAMHNGTGYELESALDIASVATVPRIVAGRFRTLEEVDQILQAGQADMVSMVRAQIADPELVRKTRDGHADQVRPCIGCNQGCIGGLFRTGRLGCAVNPAVGAERALDEGLIERGKVRRVLVVGGGPAGMEAARVAAMAGHKVVLAEAQSSLGGAINDARLAPSLQSIGDITQWLEQEVYRLGVEVRLGTYVETDDARAVGADVIIIATGSVPRVDGFQLAFPSHAVPGCRLPHVTSSNELLKGNVPEHGSTALILDTTGRYEALAAMEFLLVHEVSVTYVTHALSMTPEAHMGWRDVAAMERFHRLGKFEVLLHHQLIEIMRGKCTVRDLQAAENQVRTISADSVVLITPNAPLRQLYDELREETVPIHLIGDALSPRDLQVAIAEGHRIARRLAGD